MAEGDAGTLPDWQESARAPGIARQHHIGRLLTDAHHGSKIGTATLARWLAAQQ